MTRSTLMRRFGSLLAVLLMGVASGSAMADVRMGSPTFDVVEGNTVATVAVVLTAQDSAGGPVTVNYRTVAGTASPTGTGAGDYDTAAGTLIWDQDDFEAKNITVQIRDDALLEGTESFLVELSDATGAPLGASVTEVFIVDDESAEPGQAQFGITDYQISEGTSELVGNCPPLTAPNNACLPVRRVGGASGAVTVEVTRTAGGTASAGADVIDAPVQFNWADGDVSTKYYQFQVIDDAISEPAETVLYQLQNATGGWAIDAARQQATVTIQDNDASGPGTIQFGITAYEIFEGAADTTGCPILLEPNTGCLPVERVNGTSGRVSVVVSRIAGGTASAGADFVDTTQQLTWEDGEISVKYFQFQVIDDTLVESSETIRYQIQSPSGGVAINAAKDTATVTIADNDAAGAGVVQFATTDYIAFEGTSETVGNCPPLSAPNTACLRVRRVTGSSGAISVEVVRVPGGTATFGQDFTDQTSVVLSWPDGDTTDRYFQFQIIDDTDTESEETILYELQNASGGASIDQSRDQAVVGIIDNDQEGPGQFRLGLTSYTVFEGATDSAGCPTLSEPSNACLPVQRTGGTQGAVSVVVQRVGGGTATPGADFIDSTQQLSWADGDGDTKYFVFQVLDDDAIEGDETLQYQLQSPTGGATIEAGGGAVTVTIGDNDSAGPGSLQFGVTDYLIFEGSTESLANCPPLTAPNNACLQVRRVGGTNGVVGVEVTRVAGGTAAPGVDFSDTTQQLSWADGDASTRYFQFQVIDDGSVESTETIIYELQNATGGASIDDARKAATVSIGDNDIEGSGQVGFVAASGDVVESEGTVKIQVVRTGGAGGTASVEYLTRQSSPASAGYEDFKVTRGTLVFSSGSSTPQFIDVPILDDELAEGTETFEVVLSNVTGATLAPLSRFTVRILDDDESTDVATYALSSDRYEVSDNATALRVAVTRSNTESAGSVRLSTSDGSAEGDGVDYVTVDRVLNFTAGMSSRSVDIPVVASGDRAEGNETFLLSLSEPAGGVLGSPEVAVATIVNDSGSYAADTVGFNAAGVTVDDSGGAAVVQIRRNGSGKGAASVKYRTVEATARAGQDFEEKADVVSWTDGDVGVRSVAIPIIAPTEIGEPIEYFTVELSEPQNLTIEGNASTTVSIEPLSADSSIGFDSGLPVVLTQSAPQTDVVIRRVGNSSRPITVKVFSVAQSATAGQDFVAVDQQLTWGAGEGGSKVVPVRALYGDGSRATLDFDLRLEIVSGVVSLATSRVPVEIQPQDVSVVRFGNRTQKVLDRDGRATFILERTNPGTPAAVRVFTVDGSAQAGTDYVAMDEVLAWTAGDSSPKLVTVQLIPSADPVQTRTFSLTVSSSTALTQVDSVSSYATVDVRSAAADEAQGVGGCTLGKSDNVTFPALLAFSLGWLAFRRRRARGAEVSRVKSG